MSHLIDLITWACLVLAFVRLADLLSGVTFYDLEQG